MYPNGLQNFGLFRDARLKKVSVNVIGKLLYLEKSTRPDISCAVHQCARHCANPKIQHTAAVKRIGRYLLGTKDKGLIMKPKGVMLQSDGTWTACRFLIFSISSWQIILFNLP